MLLRKANRIQNHRMPKLGRHWCFACDRAVVGVGEKCKVCGKREQKRDGK